MPKPARDKLSAESVKWNRLPPRLKSFLEDTGIALLYLGIYWGLDWFSYLYAPEKIDITPWNPPVAATVILLLLRGLKWLPLTFLAPFLFQFLFEHKGTPSTYIVTSAYEAITYGGAVWLLGKWKMDLALESLRDVILLCATATVAAGIVGIAYVMTFSALGIISSHETAQLMFEYWAGDALGILIVCPLFLANYYRCRSFRICLQNFFSVPALVQSTLIFLLVAAVFVAETYNIRIFYLFFLPVISTAVVYGLSRVPVALFVTQLGIIFFSWKLGTPVHIVTQYFPFFLLALSWTGLILGALVSEGEKSRLQIMKGDARVRAIMDMTPDSTVIVDMTGHIVAANKKFAELCGTTPQQLANVPVVEILPEFHPTIYGETHVKTAQGQTISVEVYTSRIYVSDKYSVIVTLRDITTRKNIEAQDRMRRAATEQASRAYLAGSLAAVLAHELNQPLSAIMSYATVCKKTASALSPPSPKIEDQIEKIATQAKRAADIIRRLREFFQNSAIDIAPVSVSTLVSETLDLLEDEITKTNTAIDIRIMEPLTAAVDVIQIEQVLINVIRNSLEALRNVPPDQRRIRISASRSMRGEIEIVVNDTGSGIPSEIADQLFNPFVTTRMSGMGLGLTISKSIIEAHNGRIWAELQSSSGAAMHFTIPAYEKGT